jgi:hypothetical protein
MFRIYETTIIRLHVSEIHKKENILFCNILRIVKIFPKRDIYEYFTQGRDLGRTFLC